MNVQQRPGHSKGDEAQSKAEEYYKEAGKQLIVLQRDKPDGVTWEVYVEETCGISYRRAHELISRAKGKTTLDEIRRRKRDSMRRTREKLPASRDPGSGPTQADISEAIASACCSRCIFGSVSIATRANGLGSTSSLYSCKAISSWTMPARAWD